MNQLSLIKAPITDELEQFKQVFDRSLTNSNPLLHEVLSHIRQRNGKMMRPILVLLVAKLFGKVSSSAIHAAVALELLHTASLIHDDVVDESWERRGQASVNALYNNKISVLVGDYMLATCLDQSRLTDNNKIVGVIAELGQSLAEGELLQLSNISNTEFSESVYMDVIKKKTAVLFAACTAAAAISAGVGEEGVRKARLFGEYIGLCFQIKDDIFDYFDSVEIGKPTGNDMHEGKLTLPAIYILNNLIDKNMEEVAFRIKQGEATEKEIGRFIEAIKLNGGIEYAEKIMDDYRKKALELLTEYPESNIKNSLIAYLNYVVERTK